MPVKYKLTYIDLREPTIFQDRYFKTYLGLKIHLAFFGPLYYTYSWRRINESDFIDW